VLDSFGHASVRSAQNPNHIFMPRAMAPALVTRADILELDTDCTVLNPKDVKPVGERFIHCEIYKARPDVQSVIHTHDPAVLPFPLSKTPLRPVLAQSGFLPPETPVFDIRDVPLEKKGMLILNPTLGRGVAKSLGGNPVVLLRGHGDVVVGKSVREAVLRAIYTDINAKAQLSAATLGSKLVPLNEAERAAYDDEERPDRPWENFRGRLPKSSQAP
jgi:HCOMODA/2-hydroxy-3-carboxy-muconic semialdehyde decarboxylase